VVREVILYVGYKAEVYANFFLPKHFEEEIEAIDFPRLVHQTSRARAKSLIMERIRKRKYSAVCFTACIDPMFYEEELLEMREYALLVGIFSDDTHLTSFSRQVAWYCDLVLTCDPLQVDSYSAIGVPARLHLFDISPDRFPNRQLRRDIDILIYGTSSKGRAERTAGLREAFPDAEIMDVSDQRLEFESLLELLNRSLLTVNWSGVSRVPSVNSYRDPLFGDYIQIKGRTFEAALCGCLCISEDCGAYDHIFTSESLPRFSSERELYALVGQYLLDRKQIADDSRMQTASALTYLGRIQQPIDLGTIQRRAPTRLPPTSMVDEVVATFTLRDGLESLSKGRFRSAFWDIRECKLRKVRARYLWLRLQIFASRVPMSPSE